jgi:hypothetical protein
MMINHLFIRLGNNSLNQHNAYATRFSKCLLFSRVYTLHYILTKYGKISSYSWAILQLCPTQFFGFDIFRELTLKFGKAKESYFDGEIGSLFFKIKSIVKQVGFHTCFFFASMFNFILSTVVNFLE